MVSAPAEEEVIEEEMVVDSLKDVVEDFIEGEDEDSVGVGGEEI